MCLSWITRTGSVVSLLAGAARRTDQRALSLIPSKHKHYVIVTFIIYLSAASDRGINDPNFLWILLGQTLFGIAVLITVAIGIQHLLKKRFPTMRLLVRLPISIIMTLLILILAGYVSQYFEL